MMSTASPRCTVWVAWTDAPDASSLAIHSKYFSSSVHCSAFHGSSLNPAKGNGWCTKIKSISACEARAIAAAWPTACSARGERSSGTSSFLNMAPPGHVPLRANNTPRGAREQSAIRVIPVRIPMVRRE
jgi:hypothetical protein